MRQGMVYREEWGNGATLYAGAAGTLPRSGAVVPVTNAWDGSERAGVVTELYPDRHEYRVEWDRPRQASLPGLGADNTATRHLQGER